MKSRKGGYTIVEVSLALAVSASLILLTVGLANMVTRQRFKDNLVSLESFIQRQFSDVRSNIAPSESEVLRKLCHGDYRDTSEIPVVNYACYPIGRYIKFDDDSKKVTSSQVYAVVGKTWPDPTAGLKNLGIMEVGSEGYGDAYEQQPTNHHPKRALVNLWWAQFKSNKNNLYAVFTISNADTVAIPEVNNLAMKVCIVGKKCLDSSKINNSINYKEYPGIAIFRDPLTNSNVISAGENLFANEDRTQRAVIKNGGEKIEINVLDGVTQMAIVKQMLIGMLGLESLFGVNGNPSPYHGGFFNVSKLDDKDITVLEVKGSQKGVLCVRGTNNPSIKTNPNINDVEIKDYNNAVKVCGYGQ